MKFSSAAVVLLLTLNNGSDAFSPSFVPRNLGSSSFVVRTSSIARKRSASISSRSSSSNNRMTMLVETSGGMEELTELTEKTEKPAILSKQARKSPSLFKLAGIATVPLSAALGFGIVPSRRLAAHAVGGLVTGIAGFVGKSRLDALTEANAKPAIAQALIDNGLENIEQTTTAINNVKEQFGLQDEDFEILCTEIYAAYLSGMVKYLPTAKTSELKELESVKKVLQLDNLQVGEAHAMAAAEWYRATCLFTPEEELEDPGHPDRLAMDKFLFLTERALKQGGETDEAFKFEMTRVAKAFNLDLTTALERVAETVEPFYQRALKSTRAKLDTDQVSSAMLERARTTLGITDEVARDMHIATFNQEVRELLGLPAKNENAMDDDVPNTDEEEDEADAQDLSKLKFGDEAPERLTKLQEILGLSDTDVDYEIALEATPVYQNTALAVMKDVLAKTKSPDEAWEIMDNRREELLLADDNTKSLISSMVMQALGGPLEATNKFSKVNNEAATYDNLMAALEAKEALISILQKSGWEEFDKFDETFCNPWDKKSANGFLLSDDRIRMYRMFLARSVLKSEDGKLSDEAYDRILQVKGLLGITDQQAEIETRKTFGPKLQKVLRDAMHEIVEDYTPELKDNMEKEIKDILESYRMTEAYVRETGASFYAKAVEMVGAKAPGGIPTKELIAALDALRELYRLTKEETYPAHTEVFGSVYKKSVLEAMGTTGVIRPEFRDSLKTLRDRLCVSEDAAKTLFLEAVEQKMRPMVEWVGSELERTMLTQKQLSERRGKDMGEDVFQTGKGADGVLGLGAEVNIMSDIMELVDFYVENDIIEEQETGTKKVEVDGEMKDEPIIETVYPVNALDKGMIDQELAELLYRQFIVGAFQTQGPNAARYEASRDTFAGILGLSTAKKEEIGNTIGSTVYDNFVSNSMKTKGSLDQQDMMFLAQIQGKLGLSEEEGEKLLAQSTKKILSEEIDAIMDKPTPETVKAFREKCNSMGMDLQEDVGVSKTRLVRMFESEIIPGLKSGEITVETSDVLAEIQESLGLEPEECETMFENVLLTLAKNGFTLAKGEIMRGREENAVDIIKELVRYAAFTGGDLGLEVEEATANQICNIYEAFDFEGEDKEVVEENKELLRATMGLQ